MRKTEMTVSAGKSSNG